MRKPNLFIVGHAKTGTTALHRFLGEHPDVYMTGVKEPHYFCKDFHEESDKFHGHQLFYQFRDEKSYLDLFAKAESEKWIGEASAEYLSSQVVAEEIHKFNPDAKIIIMLRSPVDWLNSLHNLYVNTTTDNVKDFAKVIELEPLRKQGKFIAPRVRCPSWLYYTERVKYRDQVKRFYDVFDPAQIKVVISEDFRTDNDATYEDVLKFLDIDPKFTAEFRPVNSRTKMRFEGVTNLIYHPTLRKVYQAIFSPEMYEWMREKVVEPILWKKDDGESFVSSELRDRLMHVFKPEVLKISEFMGVDLEKKWGYDRI
jgi:hypothetical protein